MEIIVKEIDDIRIVKITGEIDMSNTAQIKEKFLDVPVSKFVIDMTDVSYIDSSGIGTLLSIYKNTKARSGNLVVVGLNPRLKKLFDMLGLSKILKTVDDVDEGLKELKK